MYTQPGCEYGLFYRKACSYFQTGRREIVLFCIKKIKLQKGESDCSEIKIREINLINLIFNHLYQVLKRKFGRHVIQEVLFEKLRKIKTIKI
jgi:hypothetical protein